MFVHSIITLKCAVSRVHFSGEESAEASRHTITFTRAC